MAEKVMKTIAQNKKARYDYFIIESYEAGMELVGTEVKSLRQGQVNLKDAWCSVSKNDEIFSNGIHISPYEQGNIFNKDPMRVRKLLLHKKQIQDIAHRLKVEGLTLIPLSIYFKGSRVKLQLGLCKGKKNYDKRASIAEKDGKRTVQREMKERYR